MTVDTVVKIVESEKCGIMEASTMNVGVNGVLDDDHAGYHENGVVKVSEFSVEGGSVNNNGDVESGVLEGLEVDNRSNVGEDSEEENGEIKSEIEVAEVENGGSITNDSEPVQDVVQSPNGHLKALFSLDAEDERSLFDDAIYVDKSYDCQQQNSQPGDGEDDKQYLIEIEAKIDEIGELDPLAGSEESVDSEVAESELNKDKKGDDITGGICLEPIFKPEETPDFQSPRDHFIQSLRDRSRGARKNPVLLSFRQFQSREACKNPVLVSFGQFDESTLESVKSKASVPDNSTSETPDFQSLHDHIFQSLRDPSRGTRKTPALFSFSQSDEGTLESLKSKASVPDNSIKSNFSFGTFECVAPFTHDINLQRDANSPKPKLNSDSLAKDDQSSGLNHVYWLVKIPRADVRIYDEQIRQGEIKLAAKTKTRNDFQAKANQQQAYCRELKNILEAAKVEAKAAHELARNKKREVDVAHTLINQAKNGVMIEDLDSKILILENALEHETHNLREERELVREIKQLSHQRKQLSANPQQQQEIQQARNQRDHAEEQLKVLKKELDGLRDNFVKADEHVRAAKKKHDDESAVLTDLKCQVRSTNDIRQEAYVHVQTLKGQRNQKNAAFYKGRDDLRIAYNYAAEGKKDSLERHCANQVETFMEMWNKDDEFRKEYIQGNMRHKLWKKGLLDGTQPINEVPPSLEKFPDDSVNASIKVDLPTAALTVERDISTEGEVTKDKSSEKVEQTIIAPVAKKNEAMSKDKVATVSSRIEIEEYKEEPEVTNEEEELIKKANELKREKEAAQLKERCRLEEKAKAEEALERKRRTALKAQAKAEFKARKEAEQKEKEREKRAKKKEKKRGLNPETPENEPAKPAEPLSESLNEPEAVEKPVTVAEPLSESLNEPEAVEKPVTVRKKSKKASLHTKQIKLTKPIPVALRNKGKRGLLSYWPYACIVLIATLLFFLGNFERIQTIKQYISGLLRR